MITFQEYESATNKEEFLVKAMDKHIAESISMLEDEQYYYGNNPFLASFKNSLTLKGEGDKTVPLDLTPTIKVPSGFFGIIVGHIVGRLWDNPVQIRDSAGKDIDVEILFGEDFTSDMHQIATFSAIHGVCYAFYNKGKIESFKATEYVPFCDERTGAHMAGLRFWRIADKKPWIVQLFTTQGFTEWTREHEGKELKDKKDMKYTKNVPVGGAGFVETTSATDGEPYANYPVIPLYTNPLRKSEMTPPIKARINAYDAKETGYTDEALKTKFLFWIFKGYGGDPHTLKAMLDTMRELGIIAGGDVDETSVEAKPADIPYLSHEATLERLEGAIYEFARITNPKILLNAQVTTVAIRAASERENIKMVGVESEARKFVQRMLNVVGVDYKHISFTHRVLVNELEIVQMISTGVNDLPFEWRVKLNPAIPQELTEEIVASYEAESIGMSDEDIAAYERLINGQANRNATEGTEQTAATDV